MFSTLLKNISHLLAQSFNFVNNRSSPFSDIINDIFVSYSDTELIFIPIFSFEKSLRIIFLTFLIVLGYVPSAFTNLFNKLLFFFIIALYNIIFWLIPF